MKPARKIRVQCEINGKAMSLEAYPMARLLDVLREQAGLTGTKEGCGEGECGACSIEMDGALVNSCLIPALQADGASDSHDRGSRRRLTLERGATGFSRVWRRAVRHLHAGDDSCRAESSRAHNRAADGK